jgi:hypothetical protein
MSPSWLLCHPKLFPSKLPSISVNDEKADASKILKKDWHGLTQKIFIGTIGHVAHGKSTVVKAISGVQVNIMSFLESVLFGLRKQVELFVTNYCLLSCFFYWN